MSIFLAVSAVFWTSGGLLSSQRHLNVFWLWDLVRTADWAPLIWSVALPVRAIWAAIDAAAAAAAAATAAARDSDAREWSEEEREGERERGKKKGGRLSGGWRRQSLVASMRHVRQATLVALYLDPS